MKQILRVFLVTMLVALIGLSTACTDSPGSVQGTSTTTSTSTLTTTATTTATTSVLDAMAAERGSEVYTDFDYTAGEPRDDGKNGLFTKAGIDGWTLYFEDDFDGNQVDQTKWTMFDVGAKNGNMSLYNTRSFENNDNVFLDGNGNIIIRATYDSVREKYLVAGIKSVEEWDLTGGCYIEVRCIIPKSEAYLGAFWLMPRYGIPEYGLANEGVEIDIFETPYYRKNMEFGASMGGEVRMGGICQTIHYAAKAQGEEHRADGFPYYTEGLYEGYHTYACWWTTDEEYIFYVDGVEASRATLDGSGTSKMPHYMLLSTSVNDWSGDHNFMKIPTDMAVDYVRVYYPPA